MTLYLLDANVLIRAHEDYYPIDRIPQFWTWLLSMASNGTVKMSVQIYDEIAHASDPARRMAAPGRRQVSPHSR